MALASGHNQPMVTASMSEPAALYEGATDQVKDHVCVAVRFRPLRCA